MNNNFNQLKQILLEKLSSFEVKECTNPTYAKMQYPKLLPLIKFNVSQYEIKDFGNIMIMETSAMFGLMKLSTISFMNNTGKSVPFLLIDTMAMKNKNLAYIEYYDCTEKKLDFPSLNTIKEKYDSIVNYQEKPAWYVGERMSCSLIKGGKDVEQDSLIPMITESMDAYLQLVKEAAIDESNLNGLKSFRNRMITQGNPSSATMEKALGIEGAKQFFLSCVMPMKGQEE